MSLSPSQTFLTLALSLSSEKILQQVLSDGQGQIWVGETPSYEASEIRPETLAPRILSQIKQHRGSVRVLCSSELKSLPWVNHVCELNPSLKQGQVQIGSLGGILDSSSDEHDTSSIWLNRALDPVPARITRVNRHVFSLSYDLVDSTKLIENIGAEAYSMMLSRFHAKFANIAGRWHGQIDAPQGNDGCMCYFGAVIADEHAGLSCLQAALEMRDSARAQGWQVRIGIAAGWLAVEGNQPIGLTVHLAARLQKIANGGSIVVTQPLAQHFSSVFEFETMTIQASLKGFDGDIPLAVLRNFNHQLTSFPQHTALDANFSFAGRHQHLIDLTEVWHNTRKGQGSDVLITGDPGIGKSTLIRHWLEISGLKANVLKCGPHDYRHSFASLGQWVANEIGFLPLGSRDEQRSRLHAMLSTQPLLSRYANEVADLLDLTGEEQSNHFEDAHARHQRVVHAISQWMLERSKAGAQLLVVEDYQWIDASTAQWIDQIKKLILQGHQCMLIITQRPPVNLQANYIAPDVTLTLAPLNQQESNDLIEALVPDLSSDADLVRHIQSSSQGIPLYIKESTRLLKSEDYRIKIRAARRLGVGLPVPQSLHDVIMERLDQLGSDRQIAQIGSVLGQVFSTDLLKMVCQTAFPNLASDGIFLQACQKLEAEDLWIRKQVGSQTNYEFSHALIRDVAYQSMWETDRKIIHSAAAQTLHDQSDTDSGSNVSQTQMALHLAAAGNIHSAAEHLLNAGKHSKKRGAHLVAIDCLKSALDVCELMELTSATKRKVMQVHLLLAGQILATQGYAAPEAELHYKSALKLAIDLADLTAQLRAVLGIEAYLFMSGQFEQARKKVAKASELAQILNNPLSTLQVKWAQANLMFHQGQVHEAAALMLECEQWCFTHNIGSDMVQNPLVLSMMYRAFCTWSLGDASKALQIAQTGVELARSLPNRLARVQAYGFQSMVQYCCGQWEAARLASANAEHSCENGEYHLWLAHARFIDGAAMAQLGQISDGIEKMKTADQYWSRQGGVLTRSFYLCTLAEIQLHAGENSAAKATIKIAEDFVQRGERYYSPEILRIKALILSSDHQPVDDELKIAFTDANHRGLKNLALRIAISSYELAMLGKSIGMRTLFAQQLNAALISTQQHADTADSCKAVKSLAGYQQNNVIPFQKRA